METVINKLMSQKIQILRGLAIMAVVVIHTVPYDLTSVFVRPMVNFAVAMFIFLSGYLTPTKIDNVFSFYKSRLVRVLVPYVIWSVIYTLVSKAGAGRLLFNLLTTKACFPFYFIAIYVQLTLLAPWVVKLANSKWKNLGWLVSPLAILLFYYVPMLFDFAYSKYVVFLKGLSFLPWFYAFYFGMYTRDDDHNIYINKYIVGGGIVCLMLQYVETYCLYTYGIPNAGTQGKMTVLLTNFFVMLLAYCFMQGKWNVNCRLFQYFGDYSFGIFLIHIAVIGLLKKFGIYQDIPFCLNSVVVLLISCGICCVSSKIFGKRITAIMGLK